MKSTDIRKKFLDHFEKKGHKVLEGSSLVPKDPTVLLTVAGMLQFKPIFLGIEKPAYTRAATVQKCIRTNDIDNVGRTARHHTFFEMLGNFSFGDYFKEEAISFAWELITKEFGIDPKKLSIAVFEEDEESIGIWKKTGVSSEKIFKLGEDNNFWAAGPTGPCGPCSEIYYDQGEALGCGSPDCGPGCDCDRFLEIWNLVFMQYNRDEKGALTPLPKKNIDTGMGLERIASVLQGVGSNFDTDLFTPMIEKVRQLAAAVDSGDKRSERVIADHIRASVFLIADGIEPGNEGRNYILRRLIRRALMHGRKLGIKGFFTEEIAGTVIADYGTFYPGLSSARQNILSVLSSEEDSFSRTINQGSSILDEMISRSSSGIINGADAFKLYDTYGFPVELTKEICAEKGLSVDMPGFEARLEEQKSRSRQAGGKTKELGAIPQITGVPATAFTGYDATETGSTVLDVREGFIILDKSPFYVESGGQDSDKGWLVIEKNRHEVSRLFKTAEGVILHGIKGGITPVKGEKVRAEVDGQIRAMIAAHHTSTHLLHAALRKVLGDTVKQSGSSVGSDKFRFDFSYKKAMTSEEINKVENIVNNAVKDALPVTTEITTVEKAQEQGAMALFGEKYSGNVRLIKVGDFSKELCGGTHVKNTSEIKTFKIIKESAVSQGMRRIEAVSGEPALKYVESLSKASEEKQKLAEEKKKALEEEKQQAERIMSERPGIAADLMKGDVHREFNGYGGQVLKQLISSLIDEFPDRAVSISSVTEDKVSYFIGAGPNRVKSGFNSGQKVKEMNSLTGGKGGGRPDLAEGATKDMSIRDRISGIVKDAVAKGA